MTDTPKIVFLGTHGQHNIGDELLLETFLHQLGPDHRYVINTYDADATSTQLAGRYDAELIDTAGDRLALLRHLLGADAVVFGGGSIVKELYVSVGRNRYATMLMILAVVTFARFVARVPIAMLNIGVGPITTPLGRRIARRILRQADLVTVRDPGSYALCTELGLGDVVRSGTDAVFSTTPDWLLGGEPRVARTEGGPVRIALNLNRDIENQGNWEHFQEALADAPRLVAARRPIELHGLPMQSKGKELDDATMLREFATRVPEIPFVEHLPVTHEDVACLITSCDLVVSERLHAIVMASIVGVPSYVLAYDVKVRELASMLGLDEVTVDINGPLDAPQMAHGLTRLIVDLESAGAWVSTSARRLAARAGADFESARSWIRERVA
jgi:polysaccharide pyruvyl transferase WcaK-like protein